MENPPGATGAVRIMDAASMQDAVLQLQALSRQTRPAKSLPPVEFALRYGDLPPVLAGRAEEMGILRGMVAGILNHRGNQCLLGLHGMRGQGKTVLMHMLRSMARDAGLQVVSLRASRSSGDFARSIMRADSIVESVGNAKSQGVRGGVQMGFSADASRAKSQEKTESKTALMTIEAALEHRLKQGDKILLDLDEAHTLHEEAALELFNAHQNFGVRGNALGLAFAGTPDLPDHLSEMRITFTERSGAYGQRPLNPISDANAALAVLAPFAERGALPQGLSPDSPGGVVESVVDACCGYPYYTQLLGDALRQAWEMAGQPSLIGLAHVRQAMQLFEAGRNKQYRQRFLELQKIGALTCARNVAQHISRHEFISRTDLEQCVVQGLQERRELEQAGKTMRDKDWVDGVWSSDDGMVTALLHLGFLWSPEGGAGDSFKAGIPSLVSHVLKSAPPPLGMKSSPLQRVN